MGKKITLNLLVMRGQEHSVNVGEAFVYPEYRGTGLSERLLRFSENRALAKGYKYISGLNMVLPLGG